MWRGINFLESDIWRLLLELNEKARNKGRERERLTDHFSLGKV
jgi:hypothetical protein